MNDFRTQQAGSTSPRSFTIIDKTSGSGVTSGTVNWYLKNISWLALIGYLGGFITYIIIN
jgi:hypothetical protein